MSLKHKTTKHRFYNKWNYKVSFYARGMNYLRFIPSGGIPHNHQNKNLIFSLIDTLEKIDKSRYAKRVESNVLDLYFNDVDLYQSICDQYKEYIKICYCPETGTESILSSGKTILAKKLPHNQYRFKVFLKPHNISSPEDKLKYLNWLETQIPRIFITDVVKKWFHNTSWNWDRRYMYVKDESTMIILKMKNPDVIGSIYTYEIIDK